VAGSDRPLALDPSRGLWRGEPGGRDGQDRSHGRAKTLGKNLLRVTLRSIFLALIARRELPESHADAPPWLGR